MSGWTEQAGGLVKDGQWVEKDGLVKDVHEANTADEEAPPERPPVGALLPDVAR